MISAYTHRNTKFEVYAMRAISERNAIEISNNDDLNKYIVQDASETEQLAMI